MASPSADLLAKVSPLLAALKDGRNVQSLSTQEHDLSAKKTRKLLCDFMDSVLGDADKVFQPAENASHLHMLLRILHHCIDASPESFVGVESRMPVPSEIPGTSNSNVFPNNRIGEVSKAFTVWVLSGLLIILAEQKCAEFKDSATTAVLSILQLVKGKDLILYNKLLTELITLMRDLMLVTKKLFSSSPMPAELQEALPLCLNHFQFFEQGAEQGKEQLHLSKRLLCIQNEEGCCYLQESISEIISQVTTDVPQFAHSSVLTLWKCVCQQLYTGLARIKKVSLDIITSLLPVVGLPVVPILDDLVKCLAALLELLGSGSCRALPQEKITALEKSLAKCLRILFQETDSKDRTDLGKVKKSCFVLPPWHVSYLLTKLAGTASAGGLETFQTSDLQIAVCHIILYTYVHVPVGYEDIRLMGYQTRDALNKSLISFIGKVPEQQYVIQCLYEAIKERDRREDNRSFLKGRVTTKQTSVKQIIIVDSQSEPGSVNEPLKKKLNLSSRESNGSSQEGLNETVASNVDLLANLAHKMNTLLKSLNQEPFGGKCLDKLCEEIEGLRVILEVVIRSCFECEPGSSRHMSNLGKKGKAWFTPSRLSHLFVTMKSILQFLVQKTEESTQNHQHINDAFRKLVHITGALYYASGWITLPTELCQFVVYLVSIPWLWKTSPPWMDVPSGFGWTVKTMSEASIRLKNSLSNEIISDCLQLLAVFPGEVSPTWRSNVFSMVLTGDGESKKYGVRWLPTLLSSLGSFSYSFIQDRLHTLLVSSCDTMVQNELGLSIGQLVCVLTEKTEIRRSLKSPFQEPVGSHVKLYCPTCDAKEQPGKTSDSQGNEKAGRTRTTVFTPFVLKLLSPDTPSSAKLSVIASIQRMATHMADTAESTEYSSIVCSTCFNLIEDPDYEVRMAFSQVVHHLLKPVGQQLLQNLQVTVMAKLKKAFVEASVHRNTKLQETVVLTIGQLGRTAEGDLLFSVVISLLDNLTVQSQFIRAIAFEQIQEVAKAQGKTTQDLFVDFKQQICSFLVDAVHEAQVLNRDGKEPQDIISEVASVFKFRDTQVFLKNTLRYIIPYLVKKATPTASSVLSLVAKNLKMNRGEMLLENFKYIFSLLVRTCSAPELEKALGYIQKETDVELGSLLRSEAMSVYNQLLLYLSVSYNKVFSGLSMLASKDDSYTGCKDLKTRDDMANFLQSRLLGILAFYNTVLLGTNSDMEEKRLALESLVKLMDIMGAKHITTVRMKIMGILRQALKFMDQGFIELSCTAWDCFVRNIQLNCLGPMLSQIMVTLLPCLNQLPAKVAHIFHYLIVENKSKLQDHFHEIYFLPDMPELKRVNAVLLAVRGKATRQADLKTQLRQSLKGVGHESVDVRKHALSKLKQLLHDNQATLHSYVLGNEMVDPVIPEIVSVLISGCRESDPDAKVLFGECLGELGAVDPGRYDKLAQEHVEEQVIYENGCHDTEFAVDLINELVRAFLAAHDTRAQDCSAYAIQEVLQVYGCSESRQDSSGFKLWKRFPEQIQEVLRPHLHSKYLSSAYPNWSNLPKPIYRSAKGNVYNEWIGTWTSYMITKVKQEKTSHIFQSCSKIFKHDIHTALFLLPHVILHALLDGSEEAINEMHAEIMAVLTHAQRQDETVTAPASDFRHMSAQTVFSALDYLKRWSRTRSHAASVRAEMIGSKFGRSSTQTSGNMDYVAVTKFLERIPQDVLATASYHCKAYTRALMHFEAFITSQKQDIQKNLGFLQKLYIALDEPDGVVGVAASRKHEVPLHEQIREHESSGRLRDASACYERAIQEEPRKVDHHKGLLNCLIGLGQVSTALTHVNGVLAQRPEWKSSLNAYRVEASWRLGQWDSLEGYLKMESGSSDWRVGLGRVLLSAKQKHEDDFQHQLQIVRSEQMGPLSAASMESGSCQRGYEYILRLHMLREVEECVKNLLIENKDDPEGEEHRNIVADWESRLQITQNSFRAREPILNLRRIVLNLFASCDSLNKEQGKSWLQSAKVARKAGHVQTAYSSLLNAGTFLLPSLCIEKAKWHWGQGDFHQALLILQKGVSDLRGSEAGTSSKEYSAETDKRVQAKLLLLVGRWMEETAHYEVNNVIKKYKEVTEFHGEWENGHFYLAKYYDRLMTACYDGDEKQKGCPSKDFVPFVLKHYGLSLQFGNKFIYQSMPRLLTLWLDFGAKVNEHGRQTKSSDKAGMREKLEQLNENMAELAVKLPPYQFLTAFSLLTSRICHPNQKVFEVLEQILAKVLVTYPQQPMWMMMAVSKSSFAMRSRRCHEILSKAKAQDRSLAKFIDDATKLADRLIEVCNKSSKGGINKLSMSHDFSILKRLVTDCNFSPIIVPLQSAMTVTLPFGAGNHPDHNPFSGLLPCIVGFEDTVEVLSSLQKPKKITIRGSDGQRYTMMCKPKDDLRKDCRTMEFNQLINKCLRKDPESRRRQLHIRTYAVVPLNEECGLIEWVPNTQTLRAILSKIYREKNIHMKGGELKRIADRAKRLEDKVAVFKNELIPRHPPVFHEWFLKNFPDPTSWYMNRQSYCCTTAVISMVGYILGLGDRHGENILYDSTNGDTVHVDFNCLFGKGETFDIAERVPFRLTHNMVNAMGPLGYEGVYRRSCEVTLRLMRNQCDSLLTALRTFIYDPLVEWQKSRGRETASDIRTKEATGEVTNEEAVKILKDIEQRLKGYQSKNKIMIPLSIEGQVHKLINDATNVENLAQMYIGWAAYL